MKAPDGKLAVANGWGDPRVANAADGALGVVDARCDACGTPMGCDVAQCVACGAARPSRPLASSPWVRMLIPIGRAPLAIVAGYLGLLSIGFVVLAPFAIVCAWVALRGLKATPALAGRGRAWFGLVAGVASLVGWGFYFLASS